MRKKIGTAPLRAYETPEVSLTQVRLEKSFLASEFSVSVEGYDVADEDEDWI